MYRVIIVTFLALVAISCGGDDKAKGKIDESSMPHGEVAFCSSERESLCSMKLREEGSGVEDTDQSFSLNDHYFYLRAWFHEKPKDKDVTLEFRKDNQLLKRKILYDVDGNSRTHYLDLIDTMYGVEKKPLEVGTYCVKFYKGASIQLAHGCFKIHY